LPSLITDTVAFSKRESTASYHDLDEIDRPPWDMMKIKALEKQPVSL
jgi:hypothetical protein